MSIGGRLVAGWRRYLHLLLFLSLGLPSIFGCAGLTQFPAAPKDYNVALNDLDAEYATTLDRIYGKNPTEQKKIRQLMMERRMAVIDANFKIFQAGLVKENVQGEFGVALTGVGVGAAGSLVGQTASQILSAVSGGLAGAQAAYGKAALYENAMSALVAQMQAARKAVAAQIFERWDLDLDKYPMWMARMDLDAYYFAGSLPGAILATAADAKNKESEADAILLRPITKERVKIISRITDLRARIAKLDGAKAKKLVTAIEDGAKSSKSFNDAKEFLDEYYRTALRVKDKDGKRAIVVLQQSATESIIITEDAKEWETLVDTIEKQ
mgnify:CR=1 FL=1